MPGLTVDARRDGPFGLVKLKGEARLELVEPLRAQVKGMLADGIARVLVDAVGLAFADSASIGILLELQREAEQAGGGLVLYAATKRMTRMLEGMGLTGRLKLFETETAARAFFGA
jgi:anti-anti-sigma factor